MTTNNIYNFKKKSLKRKINIAKLGGIVIGTKNVRELILHVPSEYDYRYSLEERDLFIDLIKIQFVTRCPHGRLKFFKVDGGLKDFTTTEKDMKSRISKVPDDTHRQTEHEVAGKNFQDEDDYESEQKENEESKFEQSSTQHTDDIQDDDDDDDDDTNNGLGDIRGTMMMYKSDRAEAAPSISLEDFNIKGVIGRGTFGKVFLAEQKGYKKLYAIKCLRKDILIEAGQVENVKLEKDILMACDHPFLAGMEFVFQNDYRLYFVIEFLSGGELYKHFQKKRRFPEEEAKFYAA